MFRCWCPCGCRLLGRWGCSAGPCYVSALSLLCFFLQLPSFNLKPPNPSPPRRKLQFMWRGRTGAQQTPSCEGARARYSRGKGRCACLPKGAVGPIWGFGLFFLRVFFGWVTAGLWLAARWGRAEGECREGVMPGWTWVLWQWGARPAS